MATRKVEQTLEALKTLRSGGATESTIKALRSALKDRVNVVVAKAASISADLELQVLLPELLHALDHAMEKPKADPQCWAKTALAKALKSLGYDRSEPFLKGVRYVQMEPVWGGEEDSASDFRATCVLALLHCMDASREVVLRHLVDALSEKDANARRDALRGIEQMGGEEAILLLRLKARSGDQDPAVTGQALDSVLSLEGVAGIPFVSEFLNARGDEQVREEAALALGASRLPEAVGCLIAEFKRRKGFSDTDYLLRALSASRTEIAIQFLLGLIAEGRADEAKDAISALELHKDTAEIRERVEAAVSARGDKALHATFSQCFSLRRDA